MTSSRFNRLLPASSKTFLLCALGLVAVPCLTQAQTQTFNAATPTAGELVFTGTGAYFTAAGTPGSPAAYGTGTTATIDFAERSIATGTSGSTLKFDVANPTGSFNTTSRVQVFLDIDRAGFVEELNINSTINGGSYAFGAYTNGSDVSGNITKTYTNSSTTVTAIATSGNSANQRPPSTVTITLPAANAVPAAGKRVSVRIVLTAAAGAVLLIDNVALATSAGAPLPVELTRFAATSKGQSVNVEWATASEKNNDRFEIQRSATGEAFETVGTVKGQGNTSSAHNYAFVDSRPLAGLSYYRLRQVDTDGTTAFSPVATVQLAPRADAAVYPNPTTGQVTLSVASYGAAYRILNPMGQVVLQGAVPANGRLDTSALPKGAYLLELTGAGGRTAQRLVRE